MEENTVELKAEAEGRIKQGSLLRFCVEKILELKEENPEATFTDRQLAEWLDEDLNGKDFGLTVMNVREYMKKRHDIWWVRLRNSGYKIANDRERVNEIYDQKTRRISNAMFDQVACLAGVERSNLEEQDQHRLDSKQRKTAFQIQAYLQIARAKNLGYSLTMTMTNMPENPKLFATGGE